MESYRFEIFIFGGNLNEIGSDCFFPGSNCDADLLWAVKEVMGVDAEFVRHDATSLAKILMACYCLGGFFLMAITYVVVQLLGFRQLSMR